VFHENNPLHHASVSYGAHPRRFLCATSNNAPACNAIHARTCMLRMHSRMSFSRTTHTATSSFSFAQLDVVRRNHSSLTSSLDSPISPAFFDELEVLDDVTLCEADLLALLGIVVVHCTVQRLHIMEHTIFHF
jgi:hypothetical protein